MVIYEAFVGSDWKPIARAVLDLYYEPTYEEFRPRTI